MNIVNELEECLWCGGCKYKANSWIDFTIWSPFYILSAPIYLCLHKPRNTERLKRNLQNRIRCLMDYKSIQSIKSLIHPGNHAGHHRLHSILHWHMAVYVPISNLFSATRHHSTSSTTIQDAPTISQDLARTKLCFNRLLTCLNKRDFDITIFLL